LLFQAVHGGDHRQEVPAADNLPGNGTGLYPHFEQGNYGSATHSLDDGVGNITDAMKAAGMWRDTVFLLTSDNGGDCGLPGQPTNPSAPSQPGAASNYPLLGRKCTAFEGGTRVAAFVAGGRVPPARRGTVSNQLIYITDWYPTFCNLAGVDPRDDYVHPTTKATHPIDGVDMWPALSVRLEGGTIQASVGNLLDFVGLSHLHVRCIPMGAHRASRQACEIELTATHGSYCTARLPRPARTG